MKRAAILHGTDGHPSHAWQPWLRAQFEKRGYTVLHPELPGNHRPNARTYNEFLFTQNWDFTDNILVGHSSGTTAILNLLADQRCPRVRAVVLVAAFLVNPTPAQAVTHGFEGDQFNALFPAHGFAWDTLRQKCGHVYFVHSRDDPYCPVEFAEDAARQLNGHMVYIANGGHLGGASGITELPTAIQRLQADGVL